MLISCRGKVHLGAVNREIMANFGHENERSDRGRWEWRSENTLQVNVSKEQGGRQCSWVEHCSRPHVQKGRGHSEKQGPWMKERPQWKFWSQYLKLCKGHPSASRLLHELYCQLQRSRAWSPTGDPLMQIWRGGLCRPVQTCLCAESKPGSNSQERLREDYTKIK